MLTLREGGKELVPATSAIVMECSWRDVGTVHITIICPTHQWQPGPESYDNPSTSLLSACRLASGLCRHIVWDYLK